MRCAWLLGCLLFAGCGGTASPPTVTVPPTLPTTTVLPVYLPTPVVIAPSVPPTAPSTQPVPTPGAVPATVPPTPVRARVVSVNAPAGADIYAQPDPQARVIGHAPESEELAVLIDTVIGSDGQSRWMAVAYGDTTGYVQRADVSAPYLPASSRIDTTQRRQAAA